MSYSQTIDIVTGDSLPSLIFTIRDKNIAASGRTLDENDESTWAPIIITGATIRMRIRKVGETALADTRTGTIEDGPNGRVSISFVTTTFPDAGVYEGELEVTFASGGIQSVVELVKFKVRAGFG